MKVLDYVLRVSDPRNVIACYTIFLVVRAVKTDDGPIEDVVLLSQLCPDHVACDLSLTDFVLMDEDKPPLWIDDSLLKDINIPPVEEPKESGEVEWWGKVFTPQPTPHSKCERHVEQYLRDLKHFEFWAMQMWDATAKPAAGLLSGNSNQLGDYDSCLAVELSALGAVQSKYCLADIDLETSAEALPSVRVAVNRLQAGAFVRSKHSDPGHFAPRWTTLRWGLCVPAACDDSEVEAGLRHLLQGYRLPGLAVDAVIKPGMCYKSEHQHSHLLPLPTLVTLGFFGGILLLSVVSTMVDGVSRYPQPQKLKTRDRALLAFSLRRSWEALVSNHKDELPVIHGVRSVFTVLLFAAHKLMPLALTPYSNRALLTQCSHSMFSAILRASSVFTDSFLQLSGVLTAYNMSREMSKHGSIAWKQRILARIVRLTPALFAVVLFYAYVMEHLGAGPQWTSSVTANADLCKTHLWRNILYIQNFNIILTDYLLTPALFAVVLFYAYVMEHLGAGPQWTSSVTANADLCKTHLWRNILYIQNFFMFEEMCAPHTHQLALDMQLSLLAPLVVYSLHQWPLPSLCLLITSQLAVAALRYFTFLHYRLSDFIYHNISLTDLYRNANLSYSQSIHRAIPYTVGLLTGFLLQRHSKIYLTHSQTVAGWSLCVMLAVLSVFYPSHLAQPDAVYDVSEGAWYAALSPITWSVALAWLIIACSSGYGGWLNRVLCQKWLMVLSRLSYAIYLTQFIVFFYYVGSVRSSQEFSLFYVIGVYEVVGVLLASLLLTLLFDLPMQEIKAVLIPPRRARASKCDKVL